MRKIALALVFGFAVIASAGTAAGLYLASQDGDADNERQVADAQETPTPKPALTEGPDATDTQEAEPYVIEPDAIPTVEPPASPTPTPMPTFGVCPTPVRQTPEDFAEPPLPIEPPGQRIEGGTSLAEGYVTVHLPAGRQFVVQSGWNTDADAVYIAIYDVQAQSPMIIRGDGCETWRLVRDPTADLVFDGIMATLEVGTTYACPTPSRTTLAPEEAPVAVSGKRVTGGEAYELPGFGLTLHLPAGREFQVWGGLADPGGEFIGIYDIAARSYLSLRPDGCETSRQVTDPAADAVFDEIVATLEVEG
jgi:hypothetical protein